jgi:hypothetical protein
MIDISQDGAHLLVTLTGEYPISGTRFTLRWDAGSSWAANLLRYHMDKRMGEQLEALRREAYERGWKDAKAHRTKATWFSSAWKK